MEGTYVNLEAAKYLAQYQWQRDQLLMRLEEEARAENIPIIDLASIQLISQLVRIKKAKHILEIGTAIGYSAIWLARSSAEARVVSLEIDESKVMRARANIEEAGLADRVEILHRDAELGLPEEFRKAAFDLIFIDAAKAKYERYLEIYLPLLADEGLLITDNILFHGLVYNRPAESRQAWIGEKIHQFNQRLFQHPELLTTFYPIGDGIAISIKTKGE